MPLVDTKKEVIKMANRRMFSKDIVLTDKFCEMPVTSRCLYYELSMQADDDGFVGNPKLILRMLGYQVSELEILFNKGFVIPFESGIVVITHWNKHNNIPKDRYKPTIYKNEKKLLENAENEYKLLNDKINLEDL